MKNATADPERKKLVDTVELFRKYGNQYSFDYMLMAAQGYQESRLDNKASSNVGAIGVMQLTADALPKLGRRAAINQCKSLIFW